MPDERRRSSDGHLIWPEQCRIIDAELDADLREENLYNVATETRCLLQIIRILRQQTQSKPCEELPEYEGLNPK